MVGGDLYGRGPGDTPSTHPVLYQAVQFERRRGGKMCICRHQGGTEVNHVAKVAFVRYPWDSVMQQLHLTVKHFEHTKRSADVVHIA